VTIHSATAQRLHRKAAIITGAASGIGLATAELFAEQGARLVLVDRNETPLAAALGALKARGAEAVAVVGDVSQSSVIASATQAAIDAFGQIDIVFNNAGIMTHGELSSVSEAAFDEVIAVNVKSMYLMAKSAIPHMLRQGRGSIINTSSVMATLTEPGHEAYTTSKAAVIGLTKSLAVSYALQGIRVNAVCPGWVDTPMNRALAMEMGGLDKLLPLIKRQQPQGRMASTREVAFAVLFLASDEASAITGSSLHVDGAASASIGQ
jgi:NAD(P)-dependent dehydrogenase (short-subunit alcohol dehydrogenase family)